MEVDSSHEVSVLFRLVVAFQRPYLQSESQQYFRDGLSSCEGWLMLMSIFCYRRQGLGVFFFFFASVKTKKELLLKSYVLLARVSIFVPLCTIGELLGIGLVTYNYRFPRGFKV